MFTEGSTDSSGELQGARSGAKNRRAFVLKCLLNDCSTYRLMYERRRLTSGKVFLRNQGRILETDKGHEAVQYRKEIKMIIGVPKEIKNNEFRVSLTTRRGLISLFRRAIRF